MTESINRFPTRVEYAPPLDGEVLTYDSVEDVKAYFDREIDLWRQVEKATRAVPQRGEDQALVDAMRSVAENLATSSATNGRALSHQELENYATHVRDHLKSHNFVPAQSVIGSRIVQMATTDPYGAVGMLAYALIGNPTRRPQFIDQGTLVRWQTMIGLVHAFNDLQKSHIDPEAAAVNLQKVRERWSKRLASAYRALRTAHRAARAATNKATALPPLIDARWEDFRASASVEWRGITDAYKEHLQLAAPAEHWTRKTREHAMAIDNAVGVLAMLCFAVVVAAVFWGGDLIIALGKIGDAKTGYGALLVATLPAILLLWCVRLVTRQITQNQDLLADARQRSVMISTYLALVADGGAVPKEDRALILQAIFRGNTTKNDDDPAGLAQLLDQIRRP